MIIQIFSLSAGLTPDEKNGAFSELAISNLPLELSRPKFLERHACEFIEKHFRDPFVLVVAFVEPHSPYNGPLNDEHPLSEIDLDPTATLPESDNIPLRYRLMREWQQARAVLDRQRLPHQFFFGVTPDEYRSIKQRYLGLVTLVDQSIGAILGCLERFGLSDNTIVVHTSDHGDSLGAHHLFAKEVMFEEAARVPFLIRLPGQKRSKLIPQPVSHIDFIPTLLDLLGQPKHPQCAGKSLLPLIHDEEMPPESIFIEWAPNRTKVKKGTSLAPRRMIKRAIDESTRTVVSSDGWKLCLRDKDLNELYNLKDDPLETRNLYSDRQYASVISRYTRRDSQAGRNPQTISSRSKSFSALASRLPLKTIAVQFDFSGKGVLDDSALLVVKDQLIRSAISAVFRLRFDAKRPVERDV